jgi:ribosomal protein L37AE/L43A
MPSKWLTWSPKTANSPNIEPTKPTNVVTPTTFVSVGSPEHSQRYGGEPTSVGFVSPSSHTSQKIEGGVRVFPHCPRCASYALYRKNNIGSYACETCGMQDISEAVARRFQ